MKNFEHKFIMSRFQVTRRDQNDKLLFCCKNEFPYKEL